MREIKFRAKRKDNGEWIIGDLCTGENTYAISTNSIGLFEVIPETVGQFTGLKDKNGKEIYEGDVIRFYNKYTKLYYTRIVRYCPMFACFGLYPNMEEVWQYESDWLKISEIEVIGNIHENPELLGKEAK